MNSPATTWQSNAVAALFWFQYGFKVIPLIPGLKLPAVKWDPWLDGLSQEAITQYWASHPSHEVGFIVGGDVIVLDADAPESVAALVGIERAFNITPNFVVQTKRGQHHYLRLAPGTFAKTDSHGTEQHPDRLDVKATRSMVVLPPSTGKSVMVSTANHAGELTEVGQDFIDAVFLHNGRPLPRPSAPNLRTATEPTTGKLRLLQVILSRLDASCGYDDWTHVGMALHYETSGSDDGYDLYDAWSSTGKTYDGPKATAAKWHSFQSDCEGGYTIRTLFWMARNAGYSAQDIYAEAEAFDTWEGEDGTD